MQRRTFRDLLRNGRLRVWLFVFPAVLVLAATLTAVTYTAHEASRQRREADRWYVHTLDVLLASGRISTVANQALRSERGYLLTGDRSFLQPYDESQIEAPRFLERLDRLTGDNPRQGANRARLRRSVEGYFALLDRTILLAGDGRKDEALRIVRLGTDRLSVEAVLRDVARIEAEENRLLALRRAAYAAADSRAEAYGLALAGAGAAMLALLVLAGVTALRAHARAAAATAQLERIATTDALTGLWNRRHLLERLEAEAARSRRNGRPLCLAILDVDHFKRVNDGYGHPAGDEVLRVLAGLFREAVRTSDVVGRMGGEEFAILMPETDRAQARIVCERLRRLVAGRPVRLPSGADLAVTLSTGIALMAGEEEPDKLISRADAALYGAKAGGRNRVKLAA